MRPSAFTSAGALLGDMRRTRRLSQLELSLRAGVSQRHLSFIETGRARPSRQTLLAVLEALDAPLGDRNDALLAAGFAPVFGARPLDHPDMSLVRSTLARLLAAHEPAPAFVLDSEWNLVQANRATWTLFGLLGCNLAVDAIGGTNMLEATFAAGGLSERLLNADEVCPVVWHSAQREAAANPGLRTRLERLSPHVPAAFKQMRASAHARAPVMLSRFISCAGELTFFSTYTTFGSPMDITAASLRVEHVFPADEFTRRALSTTSEA